MKNLILAIFNVIFLSKLSIGQTLDRNSADSTILIFIASKTSRFIFQEPLVNSYSLSINTSELEEEYEESELTKLKATFPCIDSNFTMNHATVDNSKWTRQDFPNKILIPYFDAKINYKKYIRDYNIAPNRQLKDTIKSINHDLCLRRKLTTKISKPVFNVQKNICAIDLFKIIKCGDTRLHETYVFYKINGQWKLCDPMRKASIEYE